MARGKDKPQRPQRPPVRQRERPNRDAGNDGDEKELGLLYDAVADMLAGRQPSPAAVAAARNNRWPHGLDLSRWNGRSALHPDAGNIGSRNTQPPAECVLENWKWFAVLARVCRREGLIGKELGANTLLYLLALFNSFRRAAMSLTGDDRRDVMLFLRAIVAFCAVSSLPAPRLHTTVLSTNPRMNREYWDNDEGPTAAFAGNRWTPKRNDGNAASKVVQIAKREPSSCGLDTYDAVTLRQVLAGNVDAARRIAQHVDDGGWMFGVIDDPGVNPEWPVVWKWLIVRFTDAVLVIFFGPWPNGNTKPCCSTTLFTSDGEWLRTEAWPEGWQVEIVDGAVVTRDQHGEVRVPWPAGRTPVWAVDVEGRSVRCVTGAELKSLVEEYSA